METKAVVKIKRLQKIGNSKAIIIPSSWIKMMNWEKDKFRIAIHPEEKSMIITQVEEKNEEVSNIIV